MASNTDAFGQLFTRLVSVVNSQISSVTKWTTKIPAMMSNFSQKTQGKVVDYMHKLMRQPKSKDDYWKFGEIYFAKRFVALTISGFGAAIFLYMSLIFPMLDGKFWEAKVRTDTQKYNTFSGRAKLYDPTGMLIYRGQMSSGKISGSGEQYTFNGKILYRGDFITEKYDGNGELYDEFSRLIYKGKFKENRFDGEGTQYNSFGATIFIGNFENGMRGGKGTEYDPKTGLKKYYGEFLADKREGKGIEYAQDGETPVYEGRFANGKYDGKGMLYEDGHLIYSGEFTEGVFGGKGTFYDKSSGFIIYEGEFQNGEFNGEGRIYDIKNGVKTYEGSFKNGKKDGDGTAFDNLGTPIFEGKFREGGVDFSFVLGKNTEAAAEMLGEPNKTFEVEDRKILLFGNICSAAIFEYNNKEEEFLCKRVIVSPKRDFIGIGTKSTAQERRKKLKIPNSSTYFVSPDYYRKIFESLEMNITDPKKILSEKYIFSEGGYFIRLFFNDSNSELKGTEIGTTKN
jgi:hypothetical protein